MFTQTLLLLVLLSAACGKQCKQHSQCPELQFCKGQDVCAPLNKAGDFCDSDRMCRSYHCGINSKCMEHGRGLGVGIIAGIAAAGVVALLVLGLIVFCCIRRRRRNKAEQPMDADDA